MRSAIGLVGTGRGHGRDVASVFEMLMPTDRMENDWRDAASRDARDAADLTRVEIMRHYDVDVLPSLPGDSVARIATLEKVFLERAVTGFDNHLKDVDVHYAMDDVRLLSMFPAPRAGTLENPRHRADWISKSLIENMVTQARESRDEGRHARILSRQGDETIVADPTLEEVARTVHRATDDWNTVRRSSLREGPFPIGETRLARATAKAAGKAHDVHRLDEVLVSAYVDDMMDRLPQADLLWREEAREILSEDDAFLRRRYGVVPRDEDDPERDVLHHEVAHLVSRMRRSSASMATSAAGPGGKDGPSTHDEPVKADGGRMPAARVHAARAAEEQDPGIRIES